jgi:hypothetical protein
MSSVKAPKKRKSLFFLSFLFADRRKPNILFYETLAFIYMIAAHKTLKVIKVPTLLLIFYAMELPIKSWPGPGGH